MAVKRTMHPLLRLPGPCRKPYVFFLAALLGAIAALAIGYAAGNPCYRPEADFAAFLSASARTAHYAPGVYLLTAGFEYLTGSAVQHYVYKITMLALWLGVAWATARRVLGHGWPGFFAVFLMVLNPYFVWTCLMSYDSASECFFLFLSFYLLLRLYDRAAAGRPAAALNLIAALVLGLAALMRSTNFLILVCVAAFLAFAGAGRARKHLCLILAALCLYTALFCLYNYRRSGSFGLGTSFGINFFIGNHRDYLYGHPAYDIDVFFERGVVAPVRKNIRGLPEAGQNRYFFRAGLREIRRDVPAFLYRCVVKSLWHWFNVEKIPRFTSPGTHIEGDSGIIRAGPLIVLPGLLYALYKLVYLPLFMGALVLLARGRLPVREAVFLVPYFALWPVAVLLFPDTRFKLCAEVLALIPMMRSARLFWAAALPAGDNPSPGGHHAG